MGWEEQCHRILSLAEPHLHDSWADIWWKTTLEETVVECKLAYITRVMVQMSGSMVHPHTAVLNTYFPSFVTQYRHLFPERYPGIVAAFKMQDQLRNRNSSLYLRGMKCLQEWHERQHCYWHGVTWLTHQMALRTSKGLKTWTTLVTIHAVKEFNGTSRTISTQTDDGPEFSLPKITMSCGIQVPLEDDITFRQIPMGSNCRFDTDDDTEDEDRDTQDEEDGSCRYNQASGVKRRNSTLTWVEAKAIAERKAPRISAISDQ